MAAENVWTYRDRTNCDGVYMNFASDQLSDVNATENCVAMYPDGTWQVVSCTDTCSIACEFEITREFKHIVK